MGARRYFPRRKSAFCNPREVFVQIRSACRVTFRERWAKWPIFGRGEIGQTEGMKSLSLPPFSFVGLRITPEVETNGGPQRVERGSVSAASATLSTGSVRVLDVECYSVSLFGSGAAYGGL